MFCFVHHADKRLTHHVDFKYTKKCNLLLTKKIILVNKQFLPLKNQEQRIHNVTDLFDFKQNNVQTLPNLAAEFHYEEGILKMATCDSKYL